jgi:5-methylcytosine-specific restriction endonuclease McrA
MSQSSPEHRAEYRRRNREKLAAKQREYKAANAEKIRAYRVANAECIAAYQREYTVRWRDANAAKVREDKRHAYIKDPEAVKERVRRWEAANPERVRLRGRDNARLRYVGRDASLAPFMALLRRDPCAYCGGASEAADHIVPVSRGGANSWDNLAAACRACNSSKGNKSLLTFLLHRDHGPSD